jgi:hypothetical protein
LAAIAPQTPGILEPQDTLHVTPRFFGSFVTTTETLSCRFTIKVTPGGFVKLTPGGC